MRRLLNTLFVTSEDAYLALENENVVIYKGEEKAAQYPLKLFESLLSFSYKGASPALMGACVRNGIGLTFLTPSGRMLARVVGESQGNVRLRKEQYRVSDNPEASCRAARNFRNRCPPVAFAPKTYIRLFRRKNARDTARP